MANDRYDLRRLFADELLDIVSEDRRSRRCRRSSTQFFRRDYNAAALAQHRVDISTHVDNSTMDGQQNPVERGSN
jgi:hypothetical protein